MVQLTSEQEGAATRERLVKEARIDRTAREKAAGEGRRATAALRSGRVLTGPGGGARIVIIT